MTLPTLDVAVARAEQALADKVAEYRAAVKHGNLSRIGNAAYEAQTAAMELSTAMFAIFSAAAEIECARYDAEAAPMIALADKISGIAPYMQEAAQ